MTESKLRQSHAWWTFLVNFPIIFLARVEEQTQRYLVDQPDSITKYHKYSMESSTSCLLYTKIPVQLLPHLISHLSLWYFLKYFDTTVVINTNPNFHILSPTFSLCSLWFVIFFFNKLVGLMGYH